MDAHFLFAGQRFRWDLEKAQSNFMKHGVRFEQACEVFLEPLKHLFDATPGDETRDAAMD